MRFVRETIEAIRSVWPSGLPVVLRISAIDGLPGGWEIADSIALARTLKPLGVDAIDCSSGGIGERAITAQVLRSEGFQVPFAEAIRRGADIATMAVGMIRSPDFAEQVVSSGAADIVAIGREGLNDPFWPLRAAATLMGERGYALWPKPYGWWLDRRAKNDNLGRSQGATT
jgi:2,4-dienoyl-CoA reductase-like NADH-dependent reductase (Old Yellow Enzyme family)